MKTATRRMLASLPSFFEIDCLPRTRVAPGLGGYKNEAPGLPTLAPDRKGEDEIGVYGRPQCLSQIVAQANRQ